MRKNRSAILCEVASHVAMLFSAAKRQPTNAQELPRNSWRRCRQLATLRTHSAPSSVPILCEVASHVANAFSSCKTLPPMRKNCTAILGEVASHVANAFSSCKKTTYQCERIAPRFFARLTSMWQILFPTGQPPPPCARIAPQFLARLPHMWQCFFQL